MTASAFYAPAADRKMSAFVWHFKRSMLRLILRLINPIIIVWRAQINQIEAFSFEHLDVLEKGGSGCLN